MSRYEKLNIEGFDLVNRAEVRQLRHQGLRQGKFTSCLRIPYNKEPLWGSRTELYHGAVDLSNKMLAKIEGVAADFEYRYMHLLIIF